LGVLRYVKGTIVYKIKYNKYNIGIIGYSDVDWVGDLDKRKSTLGYIFMVGVGAISWGSKKQACVSLSSTEVENMK
jgi:hypothetical protein